MKLLLGNRFPLKMKGKFYRFCVRSAILYGSEARCLKENEKAILNLFVIFSEYECVVKSINC